MTSNNNIFGSEYQNEVYKEFTILLPELIAVQKKIKPVMRADVSEQSSKSFERLCLELGLYALISPFKFVVSRDTDQHKKVPLEYHSQGQRYYYVSLDPEIAKESMKYDIITPSADKFGRLMGYPECCISFYQNSANLESTHKLVFKTADNTSGDFSWMLNNLLLGTPYYLIPNYYPCSYNCKKSLSYATKVFSAIKHFDIDYAKRIEYHLKLPVLVWEQFEVIVFEGFVSGDKIIFEDFFFIDRNKMLSKFVPKLGERRLNSRLRRIIPFKETNQTRLFRFR
jgi:hypothetical protein